MSKIECQLAMSGTEGDLSRFEGTHIAQEKFDGTRVIVVKNGDGFSMMSRSWKSEFTGSYPEIVAELQAIPEDYVLDAELVFFRNDTGRPEFLTALATPETKAAYTAKLLVFDVLNLNGADMRRNKQTDRTATLTRVIPDSARYIDVIPTHTGGFNTLFAEIIAAGGEGIILKDKSAAYLSGKRPKSWLKVKRTETHDCFVVGITQGEGKYSEMFGALIIAQLVDGTARIIGKCSGMDDHVRADLYGRLMAKDDDTSLDEMWESTGPIYRKNTLKRVLPEMVVEVRCMERAETGVMRHPVFLGIRTDKEWNECVLSGGM